MYFCSSHQIVLSHEAERDSGALLNFRVIRRNRNSLDKSRLNASHWNEQAWRKGCDKLSHGRVFVDTQAEEARVFECHLRPKARKLDQPKRCLSNTALTLATSKD